VVDGGFNNNSPETKSVSAFIRTPDAQSLRVARSRGNDKGHSETRGTVVVCIGFAETIEKYARSVDALVSRGFHVVIFEWRGQGLSGRMVRDPSKGHIDDFSLYLRDLDAIEAQLLRPFCPRPWFALGHSMGASLLLAQAAHQHSPFERMVLCAPMIALAGLYQSALLRMFIEGADLMGLGGLALPLHKRLRHRLDHFADNVLTSDRHHFVRWQELRARLGQSDIDRPTIGWLHAAFRHMDEMAQPYYARHITTPALVFSAGDDHIVDRRKVERFASRLKAGRCITLPYARHEILQERDEIQKLFWAGFDAFIPGTAAY
jgi:lysophospholipase